MKKVLLVLIAALLVPGLLSAQTMGVYFDNPGQMAASPPGPVFEALLYLHGADYYVTAVEYSMFTPSDPTHVLIGLIGVAYPDNMAVEYGDPFDVTFGHVISYWPPLNGYTPGYNLLATYTFFMYQECWNYGGGIVDYPLVIGANVGSGYLRGTYHPDNDTFPIIGLTSILCPEQVAVEEESWGAIKSLYE
jgi:hypothetical protein